MWKKSLHAIRVLTSHVTNIVSIRLSPQKILEEIVNADSGAPCSQRHSKKKQFIDSLKKHLGSHSTIKHLTGTEAEA